MQKNRLKVLATAMSFSILLGGVNIPSIEASAAEEKEWKYETVTVGDRTVEGWFWYENGVKQGTEGRGKEISDPNSTKTNPDGDWFWLDAVDGGKRAVSKDVYLADSKAFQYADEYLGLKDKGKWVRYDKDGLMVKGWCAGKDADAEMINSPEEAGDRDVYYFDPLGGAMAKGVVLIDGKLYQFNTGDGKLIKDKTQDRPEDFHETGWNNIDGVECYFRNGVKQGVYGRGKEIQIDGQWIWLDAKNGGVKVVNEDVYQENSDAGPWGDRIHEETGKRVGKWVRYDSDGEMIKGWCAGKGADAVRINNPDEANGKDVYYFDPIYGTMAKGTVEIDGKTYKFNERTGVLIEGESPAEDTGDEKPADDGKDEKPADDGKDKDTTEEDTNKNETAEEALAKIAKAKIGDIVTFGSYEQDNNYENGAERIRWYVLDKKDGQATLLSVKIIEAGRYHFNSDYVSWKTCGLRGWLNGDFYKEAFTAKEQNAIATTLITNSDNPVYPSTLDGDGDTEDKVWLLSLEEVSKYFNIPMSPDVVEEYKLANPNNYSKKSYEYAIYCYNQDNRILAKPTTYALDRHNAEIWTEEDTEYYEKGYGLDFSYANGAGWWWLRSPGRYHNEAAAVNYNGEVQYYGFLNYNGYAGDEEKGTAASGAWRGGIRPAVNVKYE